MHLRNISHGQFTKENLETFLLLVSEANAELRLVKLPAYYKSTLPAIKNKMIREFQEQYKTILDFMKTDKYMVLKDKDQEKQFRFFVEDENKFKNFEKLFDKNEQKTFSRPFSDFVNSDEKEVFTFIYGPEGEKKPEIPDDLQFKTNEELEKMGFKAIDAAEFEMDSQGRVLNDNLDEEKRKNLEDVFKRIAENTKNNI